EKPAGDRPALAPVGQFHMHFCGIHLGKKDPKVQSVVQHYCGPHGKSLHQCLLFDGAGAAAKLIGVEYIVPDDVYQSLPAAEKKYWHPHTYEVLAGGLIAPGMPRDDETKFMSALLTTWGKTWHTWPDPATAVPLGEPMLMWAATGDGQIADAVMAARDKEFNVNCDKLRELRGQAIGFEVPQVPQPKSVDDPGRQWTATGDDKPTKRR
ncbi:MAG TPA: DUF1264 domain-containing protein, partial [Gemmataceae bacterium]|nr:DUF1264 domain-containing protein [Gemmataceae bacterium]